MSAPTTNRRTADRVAAAWPCKVFHEGTRRYLPATTCDVGEGGATLRVHTARAILPGDRVRVILAHRVGAVLADEDGRAAFVTRALAGNARTILIAVEFDRGNERSAAAA